MNRYSIIIIWRSFHTPWNEDSYEPMSECFWKLLISSLTPWIFTITTLNGCFAICSFQWAMLVLGVFLVQIKYKIFADLHIGKGETPPLTACIEKNGRAKWRCPRSQTHIPLEDTERTLHQQFLKEFYSLYLIASMYCIFYRHLP